MSKDAGFHYAGRIPRGPSLRSIRILPYGDPQETFPFTRGSCGQSSLSAGLMPAPGDYSMQLRIPYLRLYSFMSMHERLFIPVFFKRSCDLTQKLFTERNARHKPCMYSSVSYSLFKWRIHHTPEGTCVLRLVVN